MKKSVKRSITALMVAGMTVSGAAGVYAGTNLQKITAYLNQNIGFNINGTAFVPKDANGNKLAPIVYNDTTYLPVRALSEALKAPVYYDSATGIITIGTPTSSTPAPGTGSGTADEWVMANYTPAQLQAITKAFSGFTGFEAAYAPQLMVKGDALQQAAATDDGVNLLFTHMTVNVSPRDYSQDYTGTTVKLSNGLTAKWYTPSDTAMLTVKVDNRYVTVSSPDHKLTNAQLEKVAASVTKLGTSQTSSDVTAVSYTSAQQQTIKAEFAKFDGFTTAYVPTQMAQGDAFQRAVATDDNVTFWFNHMNVQVSPRDDAYGYTGTNVTLSNGVTAKWYTPGDTAMLALKVDDRYVTLSSPDHTLSNAQLEKIATGISKLQ
jgi:hypothetical protein